MITSLEQALKPPLPEEIEVLYRLQGSDGLLTMLERGEGAFACPCPLLALDWTCVCRGTRVLRLQACLYGVLGCRLFYGTGNGALNGELIEHWLRTGTVAAIHEPDLVLEAAWQRSLGPHPM